MTCLNIKHLHLPAPFPYKSLILKDLHFSNHPSKSRKDISTLACLEVEPKQPMQKLVIQKKNGENLVGLLHDTGSKEIVVLCHGFRSSKNQTSMLNLANSLEKKGISAFRFDFSGNGDSDGSFSYAGYWNEAEDLRAVVEHLNQNNRIVKVVLGHSKGGCVVLLYASKYHDIPTVVNLSGRYDLKSGIKERLGSDFEKEMELTGFIDVKNKAGDVIYRVTKESLEDRMSTDMRSACLNIDINCRVLTVHGSEDEVISVEDAFEFSRIIPNHILRIIEGADHCYNSHQDAMASAVVHFIKSSIH